MVVRHQASRALNRVLTNQLARSYPEFHQSLQGLLLSITVLYRLRLGFRLDFKNSAKRSLASMGFGEVRKTVLWFGQRVEDVGLLASRHQLSKLLGSLDTC
jgi:hypothetical protein